MIRSLAGASAEPRRGWECGSYGGGLVLDLLHAPEVIEAPGFFEFRTQFTQSAPIVFASAQIKCGPSIAEIVSCFDAPGDRPGRGFGGREVSAAGTLDGCHEVEDVDSLSRMRQEVCEKSQAFRVLEADRCFTIQDGPKLTLLTKTGLGLGRPRGAFDCARLGCYRAPDPPLARARAPI